MRASQVALPIISISLILIFSGLVNLAYGEGNTTIVNMTTRTYENANFGIKLSYPYDWGKIVEEHESCRSQPICSLGLNDTITTYPFAFLLQKVSKEACNCSSLMDIVKSSFKNQSKSVDGFSFINDSQTPVGKNYSGWQYRFSFLQNGRELTGLVVFALSNDTYYSMEVVYPPESRGFVLPQFKRVIDSIEFSPIATPIKPSFMNASEMEQLEQYKPSPSLGNNHNPAGLQILSHNSFTDSIGYMHVVGEVQNNSPTTATFVQVTGTFYDANNQVVATDFTYTKPYDIGAGYKAPFELTLTSASVPISEIDRYNLIASSQ